MGKAQSKVSNNLLGQVARFRPEVLGLPRFTDGRDDFAKVRADTVLVVRAYWREEGSGWVTLEVAGEGTVLDMVKLDWLLLTHAGR